ncbi:MAG: hypothetical protein ACREME_05385, partial [Gemmatimonadales bacterium]
MRRDLQDKGGNGAADRALEVARALFSRQRVFSGATDGAIALAAGMAPGFDPARNVIDRQIEKYLNGSYGVDWRERGKPRRLRPDNVAAQRLTELAAGVAAAQLY